MFIPHILVGVWHLIQGHSILLYSLGVFLLLIINISHINSQPTWKEGHGFIKHIGWQCTEQTENNLTLFICIIEKNVRSRSLDIGQVLFCIFKDQNEVNVDKTHKKNKARMYLLNHLDRTSLRSIKDLLWINYKAKRRTWEISMENPEQARKAYLACSGSQAEQRNIKLHLARSWTHTYNKLECFTFNPSITK